MPTVTLTATSSTNATADCRRGHRSAMVYSATDSPMSPIGKPVQMACTAGSAAAASASRGARRRTERASDPTTRATTVDVEDQPS